MKDEELRQALQTLDGYNQQLEAINRQLRLLQQTKDETIRASLTLQAIAEARPGDEVLVPLGASSFVTVTVSEKKKAIVAIGNKLSVEMEPSEAASHLDSTTEQVNAGIKNTVAAMQEIQEYAQQLSEAVQYEYSLRQQQQAQ